MEATILKWHKQPGESVKMDETVLEIATDKVDSEVPSTAEGVIEELLYKVNDVVPIGAAIARIRTGAAEAAAPTPAPAAPAAPAPTPVAAPQAETTPVVAAPPVTNTPANRFYSPLVLNIAASEGISMTELERIPGTGNEGRVTKKDILQYVATRGTAATPAAETARPVVQPVVSQPVATQAESRPAVSYSGNVEIMEMDRMRKLIADHMVRSKHTSPHVTSFTEADVTNLVLWREKVKKDFEKREGTRITFTPLFIEEKRMK